MAEESTNELSKSEMPSGQSFESPPSASTAPQSTQVPQSSASLPFDRPTNDCAVPSAPLRVAFSALSDIGCARTNNEDSFGYDETLGIFVVCDGMGGMASGEVASSRAVATIVNSFVCSADSEVSVSSRLLHAINTANLDVWENGQIPENRGMGTTVVVAALDGNNLILGNVGDSRAYIIQDNHCVQLTVDHSYINELIRNGALTIESAQSADMEGMESVITRALGVTTEVQPDFFSVALNPGSTVLLATDGLTRYLLQDEIVAILNASPFQSACANLIGVAKERGGQDNITCVLLRALPT